MNELTGQQQRYLAICEKLASGTQLLRSEQTWLLGLLQWDAVRDLVFPEYPARGRAVDRDLWMTADSLLTGYGERRIMRRWDVVAERIGTQLANARPQAQELLSHVPDRKQAARLVLMHRVRLKPVKIRERYFRQQSRLAGIKFMGLYGGPNEQAEQAGSDSGSTGRKPAI